MYRMRFLYVLVYMVCLLPLWTNLHIEEVRDVGHAQVSTTFSPKGERVMSYQGELRLDDVMQIPLDAPIRITYSNGGSDKAMFILALHEVQIDGECISACAWLFILNNHACYTDNMQLRFHAWHEIRQHEWPFHVRTPWSEYRIYFRSSTRLEAMTRRYLQAVREPLRSYIKDLPSTSKVLTPPVLLVQRAYPERKCKTAN